MERKYTSINEKIFELLESSGISQKELSDRTGISTSAISDWKHKGAVPSAANVQKICKALKVNPETVLGKATESLSDTVVIEKGSELYEFVNMYENMEYSARKRILAYAMAMIKAENDEEMFLKADAMVRLMCELNAGIRSGEEQGWVSEDEVRNHIHSRRNCKY